MAEVFISYKSERRRAAEHVAAVLERHGYSVWFDYQLIKGRDFGLQIDRKVREAKALVALWCSMSVSSRWVTEEVDLAHDLGILVPVKIEACELPVGFRRQDYINLAEWDGAPRSHQLDPLLDALEQKVGRAPAPDAKALREYDATWRRFGAPPLGAFALDQRSQDHEGDRGLPGSTRRQGLEGSPNGEGDDEERPQHKVTIAKPFAVGVGPVTRGEFAAFAHATNYNTQSEKSNLGLRNPGFDQGDDHPVVNVSWHDAQAYVAWLGEQSGGWAYRLLSEAEWEYCCRAGTTSQYSAGDRITAKQANFGRKVRGTTSVFKFASNLWGFRDMHGNVWEWCEDNWHPSYDGAPPDGSVRTEGDMSLRVLRGGSWYSIPQDLRSAYRYRYRRDIRSYGIGFRVARTL